VTGPSAFTPTYDADGNLQNAPDGLRYTYNAENRLIAAGPETPTDGATRVEFVYDYLGRRAQKTFYTYSSGSWILTSEFLYVYDGWNMVKEITTPSGQSSANKYYVWGLDLSQSLQGAGGVGGLLATVDGSLTYHYLCDANGNVGQVINDDDGSVAAHYEYDPFGNLVNQAGAFADDNPYRFSTKYLDQETNLYYYGYRYYSPQLGRWISRDPIGEEGGENLVSFVQNNPTGFIDILGNDSWSDLAELDYLEHGILYGSQRRSGYPDGDPWIEFPFYTVGVGKQKFLKKSGQLSLLTAKYEWLDVKWTIDYEVYTSTFFDIQIAGPSARGKVDDSGPLISFSVKHYAPPKIGVIKSIAQLAKHNRYIRCRKKVVCYTNCKCGKSCWKDSWEPKNEKDQYLYGALKNYSLAGRPYCDLFPDEKAKKKHVCNSDEAKSTCEKTSI
jgi:RHS repeat-associated protein